MRRRISNGDIQEKRHWRRERGVGQRKYAERKGKIVRLIISGWQWWHTSERTRRVTTHHGIRMRRHSVTSVRMVASVTSACGKSSHFYSAIPAQQVASVISYRCKSQTHAVWWWTMENRCVMTWKFVIILVSSRSYCQQNGNDIILSSWPASWGRGGRVNSWGKWTLSK